MKLSNETVAEIRERYATGHWYQSELAIEYDMSPDAIRRLVTGQTRKDAGGPITAPGTWSKTNRAAKHGRYKLFHNGELIETFDDSNAATAEFNRLSLEAIKSGDLICFDGSTTLVNPYRLEGRPYDRA